MIFKKKKTYYEKSKLKQLKRRREILQHCQQQCIMACYKEAEKLPRPLYCPLLSVDLRKRPQLQIQAITPSDKLHIGFCPVTEILSALEIQLAGSDKTEWDPEQSWCSVRS